MQNTEHNPFEEAWKMYHIKVYRRFPLIKLQTEQA